MRKNIWKERHESLEQQISKVRIAEEKGIKSILSGQSFEHQKSDLEIQLVKLQKEILDLKEKISESQKQLEVKKTELLDAELTKEEHAKFETEVSRLKQELEKAKKELVNKENEISGLQQAKEDLESLERFQKEVVNNFKKKALLELLTEIKNHQEKIEKLQEKLKKLTESKKDLIKSLQQKLETTKSEIKTNISKDKIEPKLKKQLERISKNYDLLCDLQSSRNSFSLVKSDLDNLWNKLSTTKKIGSNKIEEVRGKINERTNEIEKLREELNKNKIEKQKVKEELFEKEKKLKEYILEQELSVQHQKISGQVYGDYGLCQVCNQPSTGDNWCKPCKVRYFQDNFKNWTSGNSKIDEFIQNSQLRAANGWQVLEWIPYEKFTNVEHLADGGFGKVYKVQWNNKKVVLKVLNDSQNMTTDFLQEITCHKLLSEKIHLVECYGISRDQRGNYAMVMQYIEGGDLRKYLHNTNNKLTFENKLFQLLNIIKGLKSIHEQNLVHRDFHSGNILNQGSQNGNVCYIADLGLCRPVNEINEKGKVYGVLPYVAPEVLRGQPYTWKADVYSWGIVAYEILFGLSPYYNVEHDEFLTIKICQGLRPKFEIKIPQLLEDLVSRCWDAEPNKRPTTKEIEKNLLSWWNEIKESRNTEFTQQVQMVNKTSSEEAKFSKYKKHSGAVYTSRLLDFKNLPESQNSKEVNEEFYSTQIDFTKLNLEENLETYQQLSPKSN